MKPYPRKSPWTAAMVCAVSGAFVFQFFGNSTRGYIGTSSLFYWWGFQWFNPASETQHGMLIFGISCWLFFRNARTETDRRLIFEAPETFATCAMLLGLSVHLLGYISQQARISVLGLLLFSCGVMTVAGGWRWARASAFPLLFMIFAIPLNALDSAGFWLRMGVVRSSGSVLHGLGIHVLVNGTQLLSPNGRYDYDVAAACSGVRSLVALAALSLLLGYLRFRSRWLWLVMFGITFPLIFLGNVARIVSIVIAAQIAGSVWGDRVHEAMGYAVFAIVLGGAYWFAEFVAGYFPKSTRSPHSNDRDAPMEPAPSIGATRGWPAAVISMSACVFSMMILSHASRMMSRSEAGVVLASDGLNPVRLPEYLGQDWMGRAAEVTEVEKQILPPDTGYSRRTYIYLPDSSKQVFVSIVLSGIDRTSIHRPELCLVGQGWTINGTFEHAFRFPGRAKQFDATVLRIDREIVTPRGTTKIPQLFAYYFVDSDSTVASHWQRIAKDSWDRVVHGRSDRWAYIVVQTGSSDGEDAAFERIQNILNGTLPVFQKHE
jgi:exosortase